MPEDGVSTGRNMQQACKGKLWIKLYLCCVRLNKCSFSVTEPVYNSTRLCLVLCLAEVFSYTILLNVMLHSRRGMRHFTTRYQIFSLLVKRRGLWNPSRLWRWWERILSVYYFLPSYLFNDTARKIILFIAWSEIKVNCTKLSRNNEKVGV
jgi:hypothetical protein